MSSTSNLMSALKILPMHTLAQYYDIDISPDNILLPHIAKWAADSDLMLSSDQIGSILKLIDPNKLDQACRSVVDNNISSDQLSTWLIDNKFITVDMSGIIPSTLLNTIVMQSITSSTNGIYNWIEEDNWSVKLACSSDAARELGKDTEWCTARGSYDSYQASPLFVLTTPMNKYQIYFSRASEGSILGSGYGFDDDFDTIVTICDKDNMRRYGSHILSDDEIFVRFVLNIHDAIVEASINAIKHGNGDNKNLQQVNIGINSLVDMSTKQLLLLNQESVVEFYNLVINHDGIFQHNKLRLAKKLVEVGISDTQFITDLKQQFLVSTGDASHLKLVAPIIDQFSQDEVKQLMRSVLLIKEVDGRLNFDKLVEYLSAEMRCGGDSISNQLDGHLYMLDQRSTFSCQYLYDYVRELAWGLVHHVAENVNSFSAQQLALLIPGTLQMLKDVGAYTWLTGGCWTDDNLHPEHHKCFDNFIKLYHTLAHADDTLIPIMVRYRIGELLVRYCNEENEFLNVSWYHTTPRFRRYLEVILNQTKYNISCEYDAIENFGIFQLIHVHDLFDDIEYRKDIIGLYLTDCLLTLKQETDRESYPQGRVDAFNEIVDSQKTDIIDLINNTGSNTVNTVILQFYFINKLHKLVYGFNLPSEMILPRYVNQEDRKIIVKAIEQFF